VRTEDLIQAMAADALRPRRLGPVLALAVLAAAAVVAAGFLPVLGPRADAGAALREPAVLLKQGFPVVLALAAFGTALRLARPGEPIGMWPWGLAAVPLALAVAAAAEMAALPAPERMPAVMGESSRECVPLIVAMALLPLGGALWALRRGASVRPASSGAVAGLLAGGTAAAVYAIHCTEDSPLFYAVWYLLAILVVTGLGTLAGARVLRW
jgi:hypothetical protein